MSNNIQPVKRFERQDIITLNAHIQEIPMGIGTIEISKIDGDYGLGIEGNLWFFNRLFVNPAARGNGLATLLMQELIDILNKQKIILICEVNPYGNLTREKLVKFYKKFGFTEKPLGFMIYKGDR